jgi:predicted  nucleic acid-binding Zn-ribbon protein
MHQLQKSCSMQRAKLDSLKLDIENVQANKERDRPRWEAKEKELAAMRQQHNDLQARHIELGRSSFELEKEIKRGEGEVLEKQSSIKMRELDVIELRKQLADKYPNIKKEVARKLQFNLDSLHQF